MLECRLSIDVMASLDNFCAIKIQKIVVLRCRQVRNVTINISYLLCYLKELAKAGIHGDFVTKEIFHESADFGWWCDGMYLSRLYL